MQLHSLPAELLQLWRLDHRVLEVLLNMPRLQRALTPPEGCCLPETNPLPAGRPRRRRGARSAARRARRPASTGRCARRPAGPRAAASVGDGHASEPAVGPIVAGEDAMEGHELEVILVGTDAEVGGAADGVWAGLAVRSHEACEDVQRITGLTLDAMYSAPKMRWLLDNDGQVRAAAEGGRLAFGQHLHHRRP